MKNKKLLYILLPLAVLIWGFVLYRIYSSLASSAVPIPETSVRHQKQQSGRTNTDTFTIAADYRDPFLGSMAEEKPKNISPVKVKHVQQQPMPRIDWSFIQYKGMVSNQQSKKQVALVRIHGKDCLMAAGDSIGEVRLLKINNDSVRVAFGKESNWIRKSDSK